MIALLSNNAITIVQSYDLSSVQEIKSKKVHLFCVNSAVYYNEGSSMITDKQATRVSQQLMMDQFCVVTTDK